MRCESLGPRLSAWVDGELSWLAAWLVARHVASCSTCAAEVEELRALNAHLSAANPVFTPSAALIQARRPVTPLVGVGALMAAGVAGFFLLPRPQPAVPLTQSLPTPAAVTAKAEEQAVPVETEVKATPPAPSAVARASAPIAGPAPRAETRHRRVRRVTRREAPKAVSPRASRPHRRRVEPVSSEPLRVALGGPAAVEPKPTVPVPEKPLTPVTPDALAPPAAIMAEATADTDAIKSKRDVRARALTAPRPTASMIASARHEENQDKESATPRKRVVPVLVVTPTRYENVVTVTAAALEVDDTDSKEETQQP